MYCLMLLDYFGNAPNDMLGQTQAVLVCVLCHVTWTGSLIACWTQLTLVSQLREPLVVCILADIVYSCNKVSYVGFAATVGAYVCAVTLGHFHNRKFP